MNTFEEKLAKLEKLTGDIKRSDISLEDALKDFEEGIKLAAGSYNYNVKIGGVTFRDITTTADGITFTANGGTYKGDVKDGSLYVEGDLSAAAWVSSLKTSGVVEASTPVVDHK